jgi:hypothetical protein
LCVSRSLLCVSRSLLCVSRSLLCLHLFFRCAVPRIKFREDGTEILRTGGGREEGRERGMGEGGRGENF